MSDPKDPLEEFLICFCHGVPEAEIRRAIAEGAATLEDVRAKTRASTGCGGCTCEVERILAEMLEKKSDPGAGGQATGSGS